MFRGQLNLRPNASFPDYVSISKNDQREISIPMVYDTSYLRKCFLSQITGGVKFDPPQRNILHFYKGCIANFSYIKSLV